MLTITNNSFEQPSIKPIFETLQYCKPDFNIEVGKMGPFTSATIITDLLHANHLRSDHNGNQDKYTAIQMIYVSCNSREVADWNAELNARIETYIDTTSEAARAPVDTLRLLNSAIAQPREFFKIIKVSNSYFVFTNQSELSPQKDRMRTAGLAILHLESTDPDIQAEAHKALTTNHIFSMPRDLQEQIEKQREEQRIKETTAKATASFDKVWFSNSEELQGIRTIEQEIKQTVQNMRTLENRLMELQLKYYRKQVGIDSTDDTEFMEFISDMIKSGNIIRAEKSGDTRLLLTLQGYIHFADSEDFLKDSAISNPNHPLHHSPRAKFILQGIMDNEIRIPIVAGFKVVTETNTSIYGTNWGIEGSKKIVNSHILDYDCFEGYKTAAVLAMNNGDYIGVIEQLMEATGNINLFDSTVVPNIIQQLERSNYPMEQRTRNGWKATNANSYVDLKRLQEQEEE